MPNSSCSGSSANASGPTLEGVSEAGGAQPNRLTDGPIRKRDQRKIEWLAELILEAREPTLGGSTATTRQ